MKAVMMKKNIAVAKNVAAGLLMMISGAAFAQALSADTTPSGPWLVRLRALDMLPANHSDAIGGVGADDRIGVEKKVIPDVDVNYFFTPQIAAELVLTYPQKHDVTLDGAKIGTVKHLPPTLTLQYHFLPGATVNPYVGAGINFTHFSGVHLLNDAASLDSNSVGAALQAGADIRIDRHWSFNIDVKKVRIGSDLAIAGARVSHVDIDPWLLGVGIGYRF